MKTSLPFRHQGEKTFLSKIHPLVRFILPFTLVIPFLMIDDYYLIISVILFTFVFSILARLNLKRIFSRIKSIFPFFILITVFIPLYVGETIFFTINLGLKINIYEEGLARATLLFMRIFGATYTFMTFFSSLTYSEFIEALTTLRLPSFFVGSFVVFLHYIPIIAGSNKKILEAQELRGKRVTTYWQKVKAHAFIMGKTLVANMERSEKLYESLKMRGFSGKLTFKPKGFSFLDVISVIGFLGFILSLIFLIDLEQLYVGLISSWLS